MTMTLDAPWDPRQFDDDCTKDPDQCVPHLRHQLPDSDCDLTGECVGTKAQSSLTDINNLDVFEDAVQDLDNFPDSTTQDTPFWLHDALCRHKKRIARCMRFACPLVTQSMTCRNGSIGASTPRERHQCHCNFEHLQLFFAWVPAHLIQRTFSNSAQMGFMPTSPDGNLFKCWHTPNPALDMFCLDNDLLTNKILADTPALNARHMAAQVFFSWCSHIVHIEPILRSGSLFWAFQSFVRKWGAPNRLLGDHASNHTSTKLAITSTSSGLARGAARPVSSIRACLNASTRPSSGP